MLKVSELSYGKFSESVYDKAYAHGIPSHGHFEITFACALKCGFCYCSCYTDPASLRRELPKEEIMRILGEAADGGCLWLTFSGGDPFIRKDFGEIYEFAHDRGLILSILCSGLIMTDEWIHRLRETRPLKVEIPLYGVDAETYEAVSGRPGTFSLLMRNLTRMRKAGIPIRLKTKITKKNLHQVEDIRKFVEDELGLEFQPNHFLYPKLNGERDHLADRLSPSQITALEREYGKTACDSGTEYLDSLGEEQPDERLFRCAAGINSFYVNPYGELNFCTYVREKSFDLKTGSISEGVDSLRKSLLTQTMDSHSPCRSCRISSTCQNCPGHAVLETGSLKGKSDYLCEVNHALRMEK